MKKKNEGKNGGRNAGRKRRRKNGLKRALTVFYAVNAVVIGAFLLYLGISAAGRNTSRNIDGVSPELVYLDDLMNFL